MEMLFILVWKMRQDIEFHKSRATMQALLSQKGADDKSIMQAFSDLRDAFFPFDKNQKTDEVRRLRESMMKEINRGPVSVTALEDPGRKKVASRLAKGQREMARRMSEQKDGTTLSLDAFDKSKKRPRGAS